ncbi:MAG TPA: YkvA family protein, partial [Polyangia bacterium]|nr:YkvA family protein [Polyangia bacterium]
MNSLWRTWFRREKKKAGRLVTSPLAVLRAADEAADKARRARRPLGRIWSDLQAAVRLTRAWARRDYRDVSRGTIVLVVAGLLYLISPIDAIVDAIPVLGYLDDA